MYMSKTNFFLKMGIFGALVLCFTDFRFLFMVFVGLVECVKRLALAPAVTRSAYNRVLLHQSEREPIFVMIQVLALRTF